MVLLAAAICTKGGKALVSRQFVEMTRSRIEGLLTSFPKLIGAGKQHTFIETESVRYVYQPMEKLYMVLITTKASNILEDLETLRLFSRVIPEYCKTIDEKDVHDHAFDLLFAFDEIVALGYRENVNLPQIKTYTEMDSNEERTYIQMRETQEKEAKEKMMERAKEIQRARLDAKKSQSGRGATTTDSHSGGFGSQSYNRNSSTSSYSTMSFDTPKPEVIPTYTSTSGKPNKAMKLGGEKQLPSFIEQLNKQTAPLTNPSAQQTTSNVVNQNVEKVHLKLEEKIQLTCGKDGGVQNMEIHGILLLRVAGDDDGKIKIRVHNNDSRNLQLQTHPNVDKKVYLKDSMIALKDLSKSFPPGQDVGVLKWRYQTQEESEVPLTINCWPSETKSGCDVNIEYELQKTDLELSNVAIVIPLPTHVPAPIIKQIDGEYTYEKYKNQLIWRIANIDDSNTTGALEFSVQGHPNDFFPVNVSFSSTRSYCDLRVETVIASDNSAPVKFSADTVFSVDKYEIV